MTRNWHPELADASNESLFAADRRILVVTPKLTGMDGISNVSRQVVNILSDSNRQTSKMRVWSLADGSSSFGSISVEGFSDAKLKLCVRAASSTFLPAHDLTIVLLHLHLAPIALPITLRGAKLVTFLHGVESWKPVSLPQGAALLRSSIVIATSQYTKGRFLSCNPAFLEQDIRVCHPGTQIEPRSPASDHKSGPFALIVGRMDQRERYKGHDLLLEVWSQLASEVPGVRLVVVGDGNDLPRLQIKASSLGLGNTIEFLGRVSDECLSGLYRDCAFLVMPSQGEGFGLVFLEAMRAGKPCIAAPGAAEEIITHGVCGYIVDPSNPTELRDCMKCLFQDPAMRAQMGAAASQRFRSYFTVEHFRHRLFSALAGGKEQLCAD